MAQKYIMLYTSYKEQLTLLSDSDKGKLIMALFDYAETGIVPELDGMPLMAFAFIRSQIDRDTIAYEKKCRKNSENGAKGGRPPKQQNMIAKEDKITEPNGIYIDDKKPKETERFFEEPKKGKEKENEKKKKKEKEKEIDSLCMVDGDTAPIQEEAEIEIELPLNDKTVYQVTKVQVHQWEGLYPAVDVSQALRGMKGWLDARPDKRKTRRGISRFINGWLAREQDKGGNRRGGQGLGNASVSQNRSGETPEGTCGKQFGNWL